uniref:Ig-like domain-containing protein n=1 Tax=Oryzias latipes TaxID=8090 RepID=A0A3B3IE64_ORYLA
IRRMNSLLVLFVFFSTAASPLMTVMEVRDGDEVSLTCTGGRDFHDGCKSVTWIYDDSTNTVTLHSRKTVTLFEHGKIHKDAGSKSDRLNLSEDCSLVLKKITAEDEGRYSCRLSRPFRSQLTDVVVRLTIIDGGFPFSYLNLFVPYREGPSKSRDASIA